MKTRTVGICKSGTVGARTLLALFSAAVVLVLSGGNVQAAPARPVGAGANKAHGGGATAVAGTRASYRNASVARAGTGAVTRALPSGYYAAVPSGYRSVTYHGYSCRYVNGVYYRPAVYHGRTVWVVVR